MVPGPVGHRRPAGSRGRRAARRPGSAGTTPGSVRSGPARPARPRPTPGGSPCSGVRVKGENSIGPLLGSGVQRGPISRGRGGVPSVSLASPREGASVGGAATGRWLRPLQVGSGQAPSTECPSVVWPAPSDQPKGPAAGGSQVLCTRRGGRRGPEVGQGPAGRTLCEGPQPQAWSRKDPEASVLSNGAGQRGPEVARGWGWGWETYRGDRFVSYGNASSLCCTPDANTRLCVNYN